MSCSQFPTSHTAFTCILDTRSPLSRHRVEPTTSTSQALQTRGLPSTSATSNTTSPRRPPSQRRSPTPPHTSSGGATNDPNATASAVVNCQPNLVTALRIPSPTGAMATQHTCRPLAERRSLTGSKTRRNFSTKLVFSPNSTNSAAAVKRTTKFSGGSKARRRPCWASGSQW
uniref:Uncharacterized protein n=1 Tax=Arundo donax TaxID=35708 RepID=A0A0A9EZD4_ARUDO